MRNNKVIIINGFQRGGTNILYNIFQSHPSVCSVNDLEAGEILSQNYRIRSYTKIGYLIKRLKLVLYGLLNKKIILHSPLVYVFGILIDELFYKYKLKNFTHPFNRYKYENVPYSKSEVKGSVLCLKSVKNDIKLTEFFSRIYDNIFFIGLVRNGYALCESWIRRGKDAKICGIRYRLYCQMMIRDSKKIKNYKIIKFEDILRNPFLEASKLYEFTNLEPINLEKMRFKSKKILTKAGNHSVKFGKLNEKYWLDQKSITELIDPNINAIQKNNLSSTDKKIFKKEVRLILEYFNY